MRELTETECYELLGGTTTVGRLAFVDDHGQQLLPVNFVVVDRVVYLRTAPDSVIASLAGGHDDVAFGVDFHDDLLGRGWSVTVSGSSRAVDAVPDASSGEAVAAPQPWAPGERDLVIAVTPRSVSGRRVRRG
ncbi:MAG: pyridoxamine 5'-phosphate oxidase family protein [Aeromicrobium sp.]|uniref:pyridoxamine 5'-phosphate oxidase family protein n=1 Tax=Aeromicrobium sp. TaxID=1871063 RepID=UPI002614A5FD|nr:pyridoxamine 5'-phosphate oxidase family protein [Aeromicrobium sp.]MDF1706327.1 pyridoxamine 5'-phosphate oxidase family protein [Aeromicrobium sp.]